MKKKFFITAIVAFAAILSFNASAANDKKKDASKSECRKTECTAATSCDRQQGKNRPCPFDGLDLTADQQAKLKALKGDCRKEACAKDACAKEACTKDAKACNAKEKCGNPACKNDSCGQKPCKDPNCCRKDRNEDRADRLAKIKEILTPEQYVKFLENSFVMNHGRHNSAKFRANGNMKMRADHKAHRRNDTQLRANASK